MDTAGLLRRTRLSAGRSQREVARRAGVAQPVISAYERGRRQPTVDQLERLLEAAGARLRVLVATPLSEDLLRERSAGLVDVLLLADAYPPPPLRPLHFPPLRG